MDLGIDGRVALVTAASRGLGRGAALALSAEGARVAICARTEAVLRQTASELPGEVLAIPADVTDPATPAMLVEETVARFGRLDILVANAGGPPAVRALEVDDDAARAAIEANLLTSIRLVKAALPHMRSLGWGRVVLITSTAVKEPIPTLATSGMARTGLWSWAKLAARDLADEGITVNLVCPGTHATERARKQGLKGRTGDPEDFGRVVAFLCSASASYVSGAALLVDGAATLGLF